MPSGTCPLRGPSVPPSQTPRPPPHFQPGGRACAAAQNTHTLYAYKHIINLLGLLVVLVFLGHIIACLFYFVS